MASAHRVGGFASFCRDGDAGYPGAEALNTGPRADDGDGSVAAHPHSLRCPHTHSRFVVLSGGYWQPLWFCGIAASAPAGRAGWATPGRERPSQRSPRRRIAGGSRGWTGAGCPVVSKLPKETPGEHLRRWSLRGSAPRSSPIRPGSEAHRRRGRRDTLCCWPCRDAAAREPGGEPAFWEAFGAPVLVSGLHLGA